MKKVYKLIFQSYVGPLIATFFIAVFVLLMQFLWKYIDDLVGKGLEWYIITELLFYASATFVPMALPLSVLLSSLMTFGGLGERYELVALKAAGISLRRIMIPMIVLIFFTAVGAFLFSNYVMPVANLKFRSILYDVKEQKLAFNIKEKVYYKGIDGYVIRVNKKEKDGRTLHGIKIYDHTEKEGNTNVTIADSGYMELSPDQRYMYLTLYNGRNYEEEIDRRSRTKRPLKRTYFNEQMIKFDLSGFNLKRTDEDLFRDNYHMLNLSQLEEAQDSIQKKKRQVKKKYTKKIEQRTIFHYQKLDSIPVDTVYGQDTLSQDFLAGLEIKEKINRVNLALSSARRGQSQLEFNEKHIARQKRQLRKHKVEWHRKFTLSFACIVLFFIGAPLGAIIRQGGLGLPLVVSVLFFVMYHIISITGEKYAEAGTLPVYQGMWISSVILLPLGVVFMIKATTDAPILDADMWVKFFKRLVNKH
ncbi:MAG: LptF/LptG family permease [Bacteroidales bacterium]|nr:LptF/LptG family permease [Bacteroidales bacterium]MCF8333947.1 LptF/LptG family permease [Bacteroidales bacterium]